MKFLAIHITNQKIRFDIYGRKFTKYIHGIWSLLNIIMIFGIKGKIDNFDPYNVLLAIAANISATYDWSCGPHTHTHTHTHLIKMYTEFWNGQKLQFSLDISHWNSV